MGLGNTSNILKYYYDGIGYYYYYYYYYYY